MLDFEHSLRSVALRVWVDGELLLDQRVDGRVTKELAGLKLRKGGLEQTLNVGPGKHLVRAQAAWDDETKTEEIAGTFSAGSARRLEIRIGRLRKNLSLEWR